MIHYDKALGDSGKQKLPFNRKKPPAEPGLGRDSSLPQSLGARGGGQEKRDTVEESQILIRIGHIIKSILIQKLEELGLRSRQ